jgi:hypothetical protein
MDGAPSPDAAKRDKGRVQKGIAMNCSMARRVLILLWGAGAGLYSMFSYALGVGDLQVESRLNQPLRARIEVSDVSDNEWHQLRAHLGSQQSQDDGLSRPGLLESVTLKTVEDQNHRRFIEVRSVEPFTEPLFDLSVQIIGIDADVTRNYTVFLDPPGPNDDLMAAKGPMLASQSAVNAQAPKPTASAQPATQAAAAMRRDRSMVVHAPHNNVPATATTGTTYTVTKADTLEKIAHRFGGTTAANRGQFMDWVFQHNPTAFYGDMNRLRAGARLALPENAAVAGAPSGDANPAGRAQLQGELTSLQEELTGLQKMIAQQDAQIASLKQQLAARDAQTESTPTPAQSRLASAADNQPDATRSTEALAYADQAGASPFQDEAGRALSSAPTSGGTVLTRYHLKMAVYYWFAGIAALAAAIVWLLFRVRQRIEEANPDVQLRYPIGPSFERSVEAPEARASLAETLPMIRSNGSGSAAAKLSAALKRREAAEATAAKSESEHEEAAEEPQTGLETWRTQTALLEQDILAETDRLPFVLDAHNQLKAVDEELLSPAELTHESREIVSNDDLAHDLREEYFADTATSIPAEALPTPVHAAKVSDPLVEVTGELPLEELPLEDSRFEDAPLERSATNKDIVKALESSLDYSPDRVDIQLKLLEIYHHEALGNRENFHTMLHKLAELKSLSPAQRLHVEMLQRTLHDGDSSFVAEEEV